MKGPKPYVLVGPHHTVVGPHHTIVGMHLKFGALIFYTFLRRLVGEQESYEKQVSELLPTYLPTYLPIYLPTYLPTYLLHLAESD